MSTQVSSALRAQFISGMSYAAATVNVVTTDGPAGRAGVTVSAMSPVSADTAKPTLLVCIHNESPAATAILQNGVFCVNVLRDDQSFISDSFAGRFKDQLTDKFDCVEWTNMPSGAPRVVDPLVSFDCTVQSFKKVGTHYICTGEVQSVFESRSGSPLIYANRAYRAAAPIERVNSIGEGKDHMAQRLNMGCFKTFGPCILPELIARIARQGNQVKFNLLTADQRQLQENLLAGQIEIALLFDLALSDQLHTQPLGEARPYVLLPQAHPLAGRAQLELADLVDFPMVLLDIQPSREYFLGMFDTHGLTPEVAFTSSSLEMVRGLVGQGLGFSLLVTKPHADVSYEGKALITCPLHTEQPATRLVLASRKGHKLSAAASVVQQACLTYFADRAQHPSDQNPSLTFDITGADHDAHQN